MDHLHQLRHLAQVPVLQGRSPIRRFVHHHRQPFPLNVGLANFLEHDRFSQHHTCRHEHSPHTRTRRRTHHDTSLRSHRRTPALTQGHGVYRKSRTPPAPCPDDTRPRQRLLPLHTLETLHYSVPHAVTRLRVQSLKHHQILTHIPTPCPLLIRARPFLSKKSTLLSHLPKPVFGDHTQRPDYTQRIMPHRHRRPHRRKRALISHIHQQGNEKIILMMPQRHLVEPPLHSEVKQSPPPIPRTEETTRLAPVPTLVKTRMNDMQSNTTVPAKPLEILHVGLIRDIVHHDISRLHPNRRFENPRPRPKQSHQSQRVLPTRKPHKNPVTIFYQSETNTGLIKFSLYFHFVVLLFCWLVGCFC